MESRAWSFVDPKAEIRTKSEGRSERDVEGRGAEAKRFHGCRVASLQWMPDTGFVTEETHMETEEVAGGERERDQGLRLCFWVIVFLLVTYVLSVGPVAKIVGKKRVPPRVIVVLYEPLESLSRESPVVKRFFDWYVYDVWKVK